MSGQTMAESYPELPDGYEWLGGYRLDPPFEYTVELSRKSGHDGPLPPLGVMPDDVHSGRFNPAVLHGTYPASPD